MPGTDISGAELASNPKQIPADTLDDDSLGSSLMHKPLLLKRLQTAACWYCTRSDYRLQPAGTVPEAITDCSLLVLYQKRLQTAACWYCTRSDYRLQPAGTVPEAITDCRLSVLYQKLLQTAACRYWTRRYYRLLPAGTVPEAITDCRLPVLYQKLLEYKLTYFEKSFSLRFGM